MTPFARIFGKKKAVAPGMDAAPRQTSGSIEVKGALRNAKTAAGVLSGMSMIQNVESGDGEVRAMIVESMDRNKNPHLFIRLRFNREGAFAEFSITPEVPNPDMRRLIVMKTVFSIISILESKKAFSPQRADLYEKTTQVFDLASAFMDGDSLRMKYELDRSIQDSLKLRDEVSRLKEEKEGADLQFMELERKLQSYEERVSVLERMTDAELDHEVIHWIEEHGGKLNGAHFCRLHGIGGARLDERLDSLSKRGVIRLV